MRDGSSVTFARRATSWLLIEPRFSALRLSNGEAGRLTFSGTSALAGAPPCGPLMWTRKDKTPCKSLIYKGRNLAGVVEAKEGNFKTCKVVGIEHGGSTTSE